MKFRHFVLFNLVGLLGIKPAMLSANVISDLYPGGPGPYINIVNATVTGVLSTYSNGAETFVVSDPTGSVLFFDNLLHFSTGALFSPSAGDKFTISTLTNAGYQNSPEVTGFNFTTYSHVAAPAIPYLNVAAMNASSNGTRGVAPNSESIVTITDVMLPIGTTTLAAKTNYTITDSSGSGILYTATSDTNVATAVAAANAAEITSGGSFFSNPVDITGYIDPFNGVSNFYPLSFAASTVPEPASLFILATGAAFARRRKNSSA